MLFGANLLVGSDGSHELDFGERVEVGDEALFNECELLRWMRGNSTKARSYEQWDQCPSFNHSQRQYASSTTTGALSTIPRFVFHLHCIPTRVVEYSHSSILRVF
jgi:hypothetical protein